jgi:hypothetical protein
VTAVAADSNGVYAGGGYAGRNLLSRYNLGGQLVWNQDSGDSIHNQIKGIAVGTDGVYVGGFSYSSGFVRKYGLNGSLLWTANDSRADCCASVAANSGHVFAAFYDGNSALIRAYDTGGSLLWTASTGNSSSLSSSQTYSEGNNVYTLGPGGSFGSLRSYSSDGILNWAENLTICSCFPTGVAADTSGIYIVGTSSQTIGLGGTLSKYDQLGKRLWIKNFDSPDGTTVGTPRISLDQSGIYIVVTTSLSGYLLRYDNDGNQMWSVAVSGTANAVSAGQDGVFVGGGPSTNALLSKYGQASSLVLFGVNPPFSFGLIALLGGMVVLSLLWLRRQRKRGVRHPKSVVPYSAPKPSDGSKWMKRPP